MALFSSSRATFFLFLKAAIRCSCANSSSICRLLRSALNLSIAAFSFALSLFCASTAFCASASVLSSCASASFNRFFSLSVSSAKRASIAAFFSSSVIALDSPSCWPLSSSSSPCRSSRSTSGRLRSSCRLPPRPLPRLGLPVNSAPSHTLICCLDSFKASF